MNRKCQHHLGLTRLPAGSVGALLLLAVALAGCQRQEVRVYQIPKEVAEQPTSHLHWTLPENWQEQPASGMRVGSFAIKGSNGQTAEVSIIPIHGPTGGELENVNRWRNQIKLPPLTEADLPALATPVDIGPAKGRMFDMVSEKAAGEGKPKERTVAAILSMPGTTWYFKITGADSLVAEQKPVFAQFLKTLTIDSAGAHAADHPPMTSPAMSPAAAAPTEAAASQPDWTVPQGWVAETPGPMVLATFGIAGGGKPAKVAVSVFPGDVGGTFANINRWRGQLGLAPITEAELPQHIRTLDLKDSKAILADMKGTDARTGQPARLVVAIVPRSGQSWFYKLTGDEQTVAREQEAFVKFVSTARYPNGR